MNIKVSVKNTDYYPKTFRLKWLFAVRKRLIGLAVAAIIGVFLIVQNVLPVKAGISHYAGIAILVFIAVVLLRSWLVYSFLGNKWLKLNQKANTDIELNFTEDSIFFKDYRGTTGIQWSKFKLYQRFAGYLFIMDKHPGDAITFKENLITKEEMNELLHFMNGKFALKK